MHESSERLANLLGAASLALSDRLLAAATRSAPASPTAAAALVTLSAHEGIGVTELGNRIGLSQPAAARMVQRLESSGFVSRRPADEDHRSTELLLTDEGRAHVREILEARGKVLADLLQDITPEERRTLTGILEKVLGLATQERTSTYFLCRLCDRETCVSGGAVCPVTDAARRLTDT